MKDKETDELARIVWDYMLMHEQPQKCDAILCLGSQDTRVAEYAAKLFIDGCAPILIFSGGRGRLTEGAKQSEAQLFADIATRLGVPKDKIIIEDNSANTGENILFVSDLLKKLNMPVKSLLVVHKPYMERRTYATFKKQWPDSGVHITMTSPPLSFDQYVTGEIPKHQIINVMIGDLQRIREYPKKGYQIAQAIPTNVWSAYEELVSRGFTEKLIVE